MKISLVIPVYNEADHLGGCLEAIGQQSFKAFEVIVVDNNSTDETRAIALKYPFVTLLNEKRQGVVYARNIGFDACHGDIIARIDADSILPFNWMKTVADIFQDASIDAVSGSVSYYDLPCKKLVSKIDLFFRQRIARGMGDEVFLYGANMAIRRSTWLASRQDVCSRSGLHEDFDLAIHAQENGAKTIFDQHLHAAVSLRRFNSDIYDFWEYAWLNPKTYADHGRTSQRHMYPAICLVLLSYWAIKLLYRCYNPDTERMSLRKMWTSSAQIRTNPATFVD